MIEAKTKPAARQDDPYVRAFERLIEPGTGKQPSWLFPLRKAGIARFAQLGLPTIQHEDWRFTNLAPLAKLPFRPITGHIEDGLTVDSLERFAFSHLPGCRLVFVNGKYSTALSRTADLPEGVTIASLARVLATNPALVEKHLGRYLQMEDNALAALNTAFFEDGVFIQVPPGTKLNDPVQLLFVSTIQENGTAVQPRNLILVGADCRLTIIESYVSLTTTPGFTNAVTELVVDESATVEHLKFQDEAHESFHLATLHGVFNRASQVRLHSFALGARLSRNNIRTKLDGEGLETVLNGLYLTRGDQLADHHMIVEHARPHCVSHEYFNGILDGRSKGVFHGRILVQSIAQKTDAKQTNKNLLLSDDASAYAKPQLEIYADDVKCTHGATIGQMNEEAIFYLRSRGIGRERARRMLMHAFAGEIIDRVRCDAAREEIDRLVWDRLEASPRIADAI